MNISPYEISMLLLKYYFAQVVRYTQMTAVTHMPNLKCLIDNINNISCSALSKPELINNVCKSP